MVSLSSSAVFFFVVVVIIDFDFFSVLWFETIIIPHLPPE
jgi:hypothetical protein